MKAILAGALSAILSSMLSISRSLLGHVHLPSSYCSFGHSYAFFILSRLNLL